MNSYFVATNSKSNRLDPAVVAAVVAVLVALITGTFSISVAFISKPEPVDKSKEATSIIYQLTPLESIKHIVPPGSERILKSDIRRILNSKDLSDDEKIQELKLRSEEGGVSGSKAIDKSQPDIPKDSIFIKDKGNGNDNRYIKDSNGLILTKSSGQKDVGLNLLSYLAAHEYNDPLNFGALEGIIIGNDSIEDRNHVDVSVLGIPTRNEQIIDNAYPFDYFSDELFTNAHTPIFLTEILGSTEVTKENKLLVNEDSGVGNQHYGAYGKSSNLNISLIDIINTSICVIVLLCCMRAFRRRKEEETLVA